MAQFDETDPFGTPRKAPQHELGQALDTLSEHELSERIDLLKAEILRLENALERKRASRAAADSIFRTL